MGNHNIIQTKIHQTKHMFFKSRFTNPSNQTQISVIQYYKYIQPNTGFDSPEFSNPRICKYKSAGFSTTSNQTAPKSIGKETDIKECY